MLHKKRFGGYGMDNYEERLRHEQDFHNNNDWRNNRAHLGKYRSIFTDKKGTTAYRDKIIGENINSQNTFLLDYGCGDGRYLIKLSEQIKDGSGIDISQKEIELAEKECKNNGINNLRFYVMDAMRTKFRDKTFDVIHGNAILHHLDIEKGLAEIRRILKDDGVGVFIEPLSSNPVIELYRKLTPKLRTPDEQPFRNKDLKLLRKYFKNIEIKYFGCFTLLAVILRRSKYFDKVLDILYMVDDIVLANKSPLKFLAWVCVIELRK
jgi:ubiquinone/menaquinone biosynthesis C-methylase UbiE